MQWRYAHARPKAPSIWYVRCRRQRSIIVQGRQIRVLEVETRIVCSWLSRLGLRWWWGIGSLVGTVPVGVRLAWRWRDEGRMLLGCAHGHSRWRRWKRHAGLRLRLLWWWRRRDVALSCALRLGDMASARRCPLRLLHCSSRRRRRGPSLVHARVSISMRARSRRGGGRRYGCNGGIGRVGSPLRAQ